MSKSNLKTTPAPDLLRQAIDLHNDGYLDEANVYYQAALEKDPLHSDTHHLYGVLLHQLGDSASAVQKILHAIDIGPPNPQMRYNLGSILYALGQYESAFEQFKNITEDYPQKGEYRFKLGNTLHALGRLEEALYEFEQAKLSEPGMVLVYNNMGLVLHRLGRFDEAKACYFQGLDINAECAELHNNLGNLFRDLDDIDNSATHFKRAISLAPNFTEAHYNLASVYERANRLIEARDHITQALKIDSKHRECQLLQATLLRRSGEIKKAINLLENINTDEVSISVQSKRAFELGRLWDMEKQYKKAFAYFDKGNVLLSQQRDEKRKIEESPILTELEDIRRCFCKDWVNSWANIEPLEDSQTPIFLVGFPRSGTTLADQILNCHPKLRVMSEKPYLENVIQKVRVTHGAAYPNVLAKLSQEHVHELREHYFQLIKEDFFEDAHSKSYDPENIYLIDKQPLNILYLPLIICLFPNAKVICCIRHPYDVVLSNFMQSFHVSGKLSSFYQLDTIVEHYVSLMTFWEECKTTLSINHHSFVYEKLLHDFTGEVQSVLGFLNLEWDEQILEYDKRAKDRVIRTPSYMQVVQPIYTQAENRWKNYRPHLQAYEKNLSPIIQEYGYSM